MVGRSIRELIADAPATPEPLREATARRRDGTSLTVVLKSAAGHDGTLTCRAWESSHRRSPEVLRADLAVREFATDALVTADRAGHVIELNPAAEKQLGWTRAAALGCPLGDVIHDEDLARRVLAGDPVHAERRGPDTLTLVNALPLRDAAGALAGATVIFSDVTAARGAAAARERQERDAGLLEHASRALGQSLELEPTLEHAVAAFVPDLADVCFVLSREPQETLELRAAVTHDPALAAATARVKGERRPLEPRLAQLLGERSRPYFHSRLSAEEMRAVAHTPREAELAALVGAGWRTTLPLRSRDGVWGILVLFGRDTRPEPD